MVAAAAVVGVGCAVVVVVAMVYLLGIECIHECGWLVEVGGRRLRCGVCVEAVRGCLLRCAAAGQGGHGTPLLARGTMTFACWPGKP
eukprot:357208-Chlamydomonas_euryale.AAC.4